MKIEGSVRSNLIAAIASARRWRGQRVHDDTIQHWNLLVEHAGKAATQPYGQSVSDLIAELEAELVARRRSRKEGGHPLHRRK